MKGTLTHKKNIDSVFKGKSLVGKYVLLKFIESEDPKYLVVAPIKKWRRAVDRNKIKRLMRESIKDFTFTKDVAIVYISKEIQSFDNIKKDISKLLNRL